MSPRSAYPLRAIMFIEEFGEGGSRNKVKLVCGHSVRSDATYRARCRECGQMSALALLVSLYGDRKQA